MIFLLLHVMCDLMVHVLPFAVLNAVTGQDGSRKKSDVCSPQYKWAWPLPVGVVKIAKLCQNCRKNRGTIKSYLFTYM